jgi:hypothetical protein
MSAADHEEHAYATWQPAEALQHEDRVKLVRYASKLTARPETERQLRTIAMCGPLSAVARHELNVGIATVAASLMSHATVLPIQRSSKRVTVANIHQAGDSANIFTPTLKLMGGHRVESPWTAKRKAELKTLKGTAVADREKEVEGGGASADASEAPRSTGGKRKRGASHKEKKLLKKDEEEPEQQQEETEKQVEESHTRRHSKRTRSSQ